MRAIIGITCLLVGFGMLSCRFERVAESHSVAPPTMKWVRTVDGWERPDSWSMPPVAPLRLHPLVVAAAQGLLSVLALAACGKSAPSQTADA